MLLDTFLGQRLEELDNSSGYPLSINVKHSIYPLIKEGNLENYLKLLYPHSELAVALLQPIQEGLAIM